MKYILSESFCQEYSLRDCISLRDFPDEYLEELHFLVTFFFLLSADMSYLSKDAIFRDSLRLAILAVPLDSVKMARKKLTKLKSRKFVR